MCAMINSEGIYPTGTNLLPNSPLLAHASINKFDQPESQHIVHAHPAKPPTRRPVTFLNTASKMTPRPMARKNPPTLANSVPRPKPHMPKSCRTALQKKAPMTLPTRPTSAVSGFAPMPMKEPRKTYAKRSKSVDVGRVWGRDAKLPDATASPNTPRVTETATGNQRASATGWAPA